MAKPLLNTPTLLTLGRIAAIPVFVIAFYMHSKWSNVLAAAIFLLAALTDYLDGYLARRWNQMTRFGAFLDPVADKLMVSTALVVLVGEHATPWLSVPAVVVVAREITVSALREWMAEVGQRAAVAVSHIGKIKTTVQMTAITLLLAVKPGFDAGGDIIFTNFFLFNYALMYIAALLTLWSMVLYLQAAWPHMREID